MSRSILIKDGRIIDPRNGMDAVSDLLILEGKVAEVGKALAAPEGTLVLNARGLVVSPGFVDLHCHLREPGFEEKETIATGTLAAARGGFTTVCCMPNTQPAIDTRATVDFILAKARSEGAVRVLPVAAVTKGRTGGQLVEMGELAEAGAVGFSDDGDPVADPRLMRSALTYTRPLGLPVMDHCEDPSLSGGVMHEGKVSTRLGLRGIPAAAEESMVARDILLAELAGGSVHIAHISAAGSVELVRRAKAKGLPVTAEVTPHHLTLTHEWVTGDGTTEAQQPAANAGYPYDTNTKVNPPLRESADVDVMVEALREGIIDAIATDHAPHTIVEKLCPYDEAAFGISVLETGLGSVLSLFHQGRIDLPTLVARLTVGPAGIIDHGGLGLGTLSVGAPGDVTVFDPDIEWVVDVERFSSKGRNSPLHGRRLKGGVVATVFNGSVVFEGSREAVTDGR